MGLRSFSCGRGGLRRLDVHSLLPVGDAGGGVQALYAVAVRAGKDLIRVASFGWDWDSAQMLTYVWVFALRPGQARARMKGNKNGATSVENDPFYLR